MLVAAERNQKLRENDESQEKPVLMVLETSDNKSWKNSGI